MPGFPPEEVTPFVFSDPTGKRWPRLRLVLLIGGVLFFLGTVLFVQTLFVAPHMNVPFSLRQLKGQLKALQKKNPAGQYLQPRCFGKNLAQPGKRQETSPPQRQQLRRGRTRNRPTTKCDSHFTSMAILTATRHFRSTSRRLLIFARNG